MGCGASKPINVEPVLTADDHRYTNDRSAAAQAAAFSSPTSTTALAPTTPSSSITNFIPQEHQQQSRQPPTQTIGQVSGNSNEPSPASLLMNGGEYVSQHRHPSPGDSGAVKPPVPQTPSYSNQNGSLLSNPSTALTTTTSNVVAGKDDPQWEELWKSYQEILLDPADVHATLQDLMANFTNKLSDTELLYIQRKVRTIVKQSQYQKGDGNLNISNHVNNGNNGNNGGVVKGRKGRSRSLSQNSNANDIGTNLFREGCASPQDTKTVARNHHLLTSYVVQQLLPKPPVPTNIQNPLHLLNKSPSHDSNTSLGSMGSASENNNHINGNTTGPSTVRTVETTYLLALFCNDSLWDRVADIAVQSARDNDLEMDVNKQILANMTDSSNGSTSLTNGSHPTSPSNISLKIPEPCPPMLDRAPEIPVGVGLHALTFLHGLALRGTRQQQLNLLFYLLLPPKRLLSFLKRHPSGGVPTWLLEVGQDSVISLASLSHYYWYGGGSTDSPYLPWSSPSSSHRKGQQQRHIAWNKQQQVLSLRIPGREVIQFFMAILLPELSQASTDASSPSGGNHLNNNAAPSSPKKPSLGFKRRLSQSKEAIANMTNDSTPNQEDSDTMQTDVMERLQQQALVAASKSWTSDSINALNDYCTEAGRMRFSEQAAVWLQHHPSTISEMTIVDFDAFCQQALDDGCVAAITHRLFALGSIPNPSLELDLVKSRWREWQESSDAIQEWTKAAGETSDGRLELLSQNVRRIVSTEGGGEVVVSKRARKPFGGLGGFDGRGGTGFGLLYCIDKTWWDAWEEYVGWSWAGDAAVTASMDDMSVRSSMGQKSFRPPIKKRPGELNTERLLNRDEDYFVAGSLGSYELMKTGLKKDVDYVLVPPAVWDVLYELYSGGPPLPRMVSSPEQRYMPSSGVATEANIEVCETNGSRELLEVPTELDLDAMASTDYADRVLRIPRLMEVETHPWVLQFQLCDPQQPYRKQEHNDAGPLTIRVMAAPNQPLWRLYAEIIVRLPFHMYRAYGSDGRGQVRLWKRIEQSGPKNIYGPWPCTLLCKNRVAILPRQDIDQELEDNYEELKADWEAYTDHATVESSGLADGNNILVEFAVVHRNGEMVWPREAAAKAGRVRRLADKDMQFRRMLLGLDGYGKPLSKAPELVGMSVDAMDASGRWYEVHISQLRNVDPDTDEEDDDSLDDTPGQGCRQVRVDFSRYGGHAEWIDVESDRLASAGRFTMGKADDPADSPIKPAQPSPSPPDGKSKAQAQIKKAVQDTAETSTKVCTIPGYGACGLANLGNTCYINSGLQCISYFPMLRSYLLSGEYKTTGDLNKDNPLGTEGKLLEEFVDLLRFMWSGKSGEKSPTRMRHLIAKLKPDVFAGADQQDAQELLSYVLDALMEDSNRVRKKPYVEGLEDDWVRKMKLARVGDEAWRRERRRSRSIVTDVVTGQTLSTTTCPVCNYASHKFDIFNLLSVPLPTVADVMFKCYIVRRANAYNTPWTLNRPKSKNGKAKSRFGPGPLVNPKPPSEQLIVEQYIIAMSRLADTSDLRQKIHQLSGIAAQDLIICSAEEKLTMKDKDDGTVVKRRTDICVLNNKKGPCSQFAPRQRTTSEDLGTTPSTSVMLVAFECTLRPRPPDRAENGNEGSESNDDENEEEGRDTPDLPTLQERKQLEQLVMQYGNVEECRLYDTDALPLAKAVSRSIWPTKEEELKLGLRVDAIDHKDGWFSGSVVEILEHNPTKGESKDEDIAIKTKVRIHFDNFSSRWDEMYTIEHFIDGKVRPLYSHATPRVKYSDFIVHHRYTDRITRASYLFGQSFYVQCHSEWSTARAGAQILAQASRFLRQGPIPIGPVDIDAAQEREAKIERLYERTQSVISELIDILVEFDREYVLGALGFSGNKDASSVEFRNPSFDASLLSSTLVKRVNERLHRLPFEVRVCPADSPLPGSSNEEVAFPFSLMRTIGNYMSARHAIVLQWREPPSDKKANATAPHLRSNYLGAPVMYVPPQVVTDEASAEILNKVNQKAKKKAPGRGSAGLPLGICLTEFCKVQKLGENDEEETHWRCPRCKEFRPGANQKMVLWRLPDILTIHLKRFRSSHKWREKITTKVNFPLTGLDMQEWCHQESPVVQDETGESYVYDLIGVINHLGGMTGGHYVTTCKATPCTRDGREEVAYDFTGFGTTMPVSTDDESDAPTGWKFGRQKVEVNQNKLIAAATAKAAGESAEPLWLQFDDEYVEPIPPRDIVTETAYVLFYRRRRLTTANVARYSTLE